VEEAKQRVRLRRRQHRRRLVEDQDLGAAPERLDDLDPLLQPDREVADAGVRVDVEAVVAGEAGELGPRLSRAARPAPLRAR
jgi:hypothetical protein